MEVSTNLPSDVKRTSAIVHMALIGLALYGFALLSHMETGVVGKTVADYGLLLFGRSAFLVPALLIFLVLEQWFSLWRKRYASVQYMPVWMRWIGSVLLLFVSCGVAALHSPELPSGVVGIWLSMQLIDLFGHIGAFLLLHFLLAVSVFLATDLNWPLVFERTGLLVIEPFQQLSRTGKAHTTQKPTNKAASDQKPTNPFTAWHKPIVLFAQRVCSGMKAALNPLHKLYKKREQPAVSMTGASPVLGKNVSNASKEVSSALAEPKLGDKTFNFVVDEQPHQPLDTPVSGMMETTDIAIAGHREMDIEVKAAQPVKVINMPLSTGHQLPRLDLLDPILDQKVGFSTEELQIMGQRLQDSLQHFNITVEVESVQPGPVITLFEVQPAPGVKISQISLLSKDVARALAVQSVRVVEVIPGKSCIGIEIPNPKRETVSFREVMSSENFQLAADPMTLALGKDSAGEALVVNLAKMPHLLVAGTTGSGKSVGVNAMILSLLYKAHPDEVKFIMIDPKMLELSVYDGLPHLLMPVVTDMTLAANSLKWCVAEMERRYKLMSLLGVRNIKGLNEKIATAANTGSPVKDPLYKPKAAYGHELAEDPPVLESMPYIVVIIDEFADLMMVAGKQVEELVARLAQKARAAGIHLILATQRPSVNVITGLIKANIPTRLSFQVSTKIDSRTILDQGGAEQLLGMGDMLYFPPGSGAPVRAHGAFISDEAVHKVAAFVKENNNPPAYIENVNEEVEASDDSLLSMSGSSSEADLYEKAVAVVLESKRPSISRLQRTLRIGYNRAARLIEDMERNGIVSAPNTAGAREIL